MRNLGLVALASATITIAAAACGGASPPPAPPPPPPPPDASAPAPSAAPAAAPAPPPAKPSLAELVPQTLNGLNDAFVARDAKKFAGFFADDGTSDDYGQPTQHGRDEVAKAMQVFFDAFSDVKSAVLRAWVKGNAVVSESVWAGTMTGDLMILRASHKPAGQLRLQVMTFDDDGRIKALRIYADQVGLVGQMTGRKGAPPVPIVPTNPPDIHFAKNTPDEDKLADWAKAIDEAAGKDDASAAAAEMAPDADTWINFTGVPAYRGKKDVGRALAAWFKAFPDQKWSVTGAWGVDGFAIVEHTMTGTQKGPLGPLAASNKPVSNWHWADIWQPNAEGKIEHGWAYANALELLQQTGGLGLLLKPSAIPAPR